MMQEDNPNKRKSHQSDQHHSLGLHDLKKATSTQRKTHFYHPTPAPDTVVVHSIPKKTNDACCWGCAAALCLCFGLKECCQN